MEQASKKHYRLVYSSRKTIGIYVSAEKGVEVRAPRHLPEREIMCFVQSKQGWIDKQLKKINALPLRYDPGFCWGSEHYVLGERHTIQYVDSAYDACTASSILLKGAEGDGHEIIKRRYHAWFRAKALVLFQERHGFWRRQLSSWELPESNVQTRFMKRRWGSCYRNGKIILNTHLAKYPVACVDVAIVHELCHLKEFNHSPRFYGWMTRAMPDWKTQDAQLDTLSRLY